MDAGGLEVEEAEEGGAVHGGRGPSRGLRGIREKALARGRRSF